MHATWKATHRAAADDRASLQQQQQQQQVPRDMEIEERITKRRAADLAGRMNSYGGMGMDSISEMERALRIAELNYMSAHPDLFPHKAGRRPRTYAALRDQR
jgi:hypothetical protein